MASNSAVASSQQQHFQQPNSQHHCKECGLFFDSGKSLDCHLQYHKENLLNKWANQASHAAAQHGADETNNNSSTKSNNNKREFSSLPVAAAADSSDAMLKSAAKSPEHFSSRTTPETSTSYNHPPTPQSYASASSPYQNPDGNSFSPNFPAFQQVKLEPSSPVSHYQNFAPPTQHYGENQFFNMEQPHQPGYPQEYPLHKLPQPASFRYHPYQQQPQQQQPAPQPPPPQQQQQFERNPQVSSSSPAYPSQNPQPTPSPSPKQCDKCGCVCDSAAQLVEHLNVAHPPTPAPHMQQSQQFFQYSNSIEVKNEPKVEDEQQTEILDLDSHKVHQVYQSPEEQEESMKRQNGELGSFNGPSSYSVSSMLSSWPGSQQKMFSGSGPEQKMLFNGNPDGKFMPQDQKLFQPHQMQSNDFLANGVTTTTHETSPNMIVPTVANHSPIGQPYRPFDHHLPPQPNPPVISSTQIPNSVNPANPAVIPPKGANWKSNEARRPKTYNCSACNKWFTSSGHLKRHYNTTLHKNAVKSSGQPDPATLPISVHHHPSRADLSGGRSNEPNLSPSPTDDSRDESAMQHPLMHQSPNGHYERQPGASMGPQAPGLHSPMGQNSLTNLSAGSPPNGEAGPSATTNLDPSRGLLSISTPSTPQQTTPLSPMVSGMGSHLPAFLGHPTQHMMAMASPGAANHHPHTQAVYHHQTMSPPANYPNALAPHVMQTMATTSSQPLALPSLTTTGEMDVDFANFHQHHHHHQQHQDHQQYLVQPVPNDQPLPSFAQFQQQHRFGILLTTGYPSNVGGLDPATDPPIYQELAEPTHYSHAAGESTDGAHYEITLLEQPEPYSPPNHNNNNNNNNNNHNNNNNNSKGNIAEVKEVMKPQAPYPVAIVKRVEKVLPLPMPMPMPMPISASITKRDYENGSPQISSTGSPLAQKQVQVTPHKCYDCDKVFNKACYLTQHNKTFHCGDKPFKCHRCGKRFPCNRTYEDHLAKHAGDKPYKCELCPKQFNHKTDLRRHMCLHTGQKPYACDHCGKGFIRKDHMLKHCETHTRKNKNSSVAPAAVVAAAMH